jgi:hypothetical protein
MDTHRYGVDEWHLPFQYLDTMQLTIDTHVYGGD